jgi:hypothetical protein
MLKKLLNNLKDFKFLNIFLIFAFLLFLKFYLIPSNAMACSTNGEMYFDAERFGYIACLDGEEKRLGSSVSAGNVTCSDASVVEWNSADSVLEYCNDYKTVSMKCGAALGACTLAGAQRYDTDDMQMCDGSDWYSMSSETCVDDLTSVNWVAVTGSGTLFTSEDGENWIWTDVPIDTNNSLSVVTYGDDRWLAGGSNGTLITSTDGKTWTVIDISAISTDSITAIAFGDGNWMLSFIGGPGDAAKAFSSDGLNWISIPVGNAYTRHLAYARGHWFSTGFNVYRSSNNGSNWTNVLTMTGSNRMTYGNGKWALASKTDSPNNWRYSEDEGDSWITWDPITPNTTTTIYGFEYLKNNFYFSDQSSNILYTPDLQGSATRRSVGQIAKSFDYGNGQWVLSRYTRGIESSSDNLSTNTEQYRINKSINSIEYGSIINDPGDLAFTDQTDVSLTTAIISNAFTLDISMTSAQEISMTSISGNLEEKISTIQVGTDITHWSVVTEP